jgi:hypothetical protein
MKFNVILFLLTHVHIALHIEYTDFIYIMFSTILKTADLIIHYVGYVFILLNIGSTWKIMREKYLNS